MTGGARGISVVKLTMPEKRQGRSGVANATGAKVVTTKASAKSTTGG